MSATALPADALLGAVTDRELAGDGLLQRGAERPLAADGVVWTPLAITLTGDGALTAATAVALAGDLLLGETALRLLPTDAMVQSSGRRDLLGDLYLVREGVLLLRTDAEVTLPLVIRGRRVISRRGGAVPAHPSRVTGTRMISRRVAGTPRQSMEGILAISRIAAPSTNRRLALEDLRVDGAPLTALGPDDTIHYRLYGPDQQLVTEGDPVYGLVRIDRPQTIFARNVFGWYADVLLPEPLGLYRVAWDLDVAGTIEAWDDQIEIRART